MDLLRSLFTVSGMTLISRILGFARDAVVAQVFGAGPATDAFFVAFRLPNLLRRVFGEGAFSQAWVPLLAEYKTVRGEADTRLLVDHVSGLLALALLVVTALGVVFAPAVVVLSAPGFAASADKFAITVTLLRITFPYILFISLVSLAGGILNTYGRFAVPAFTPTLLNVAFIVFAALLAPWFHPPVLALAWAVFAGGVLQLAFQFPFLARLGLVPRFRLDLHDAGVWRVLRLMGPAIFGVSISQISLLINTMFASYLPDGSVSWLYYADRLMEFPTGILGVALGTILLPSLSRTHAAAAGAEFSRLLDWGLRLTLLLALPAALGLALLAGPLVATLFQHGAFGLVDVGHTADALVAYSVGLVGLILVKVLAPGFYARQDVRTPVRIGIFTLLVTQLLNLVLVAFLRHAGLALAISLGACVNAGLLFRGLRRQGAYRPEPGWGGFGLRLATALAAMGLALLLLRGGFAGWTTGSTAGRALRLSAVVAAAAGTYFLVLWRLGLRPRDFVRRAA